MTTCPETFRRTPPARLGRLRDRYQRCITHPAEPGCPPSDYAAAVLAELDAALTATGTAR